MPRIHRIRRCRCSICRMQPSRSSARGAKKRGYVTADQINAVLPSEEVNSEQIEDVLAMFSEMGVNVVENEDAEPEDEAREEPDEEPEGGEVVEVQRMCRSRPRPRSRRSAPMIR